MMTADHVEIPHIRLYKLISPALIFAADEVFFNNWASAYRWKAYFTVFQTVPMLSVRYDIIDGQYLDEYTAISIIGMSFFGLYRVIQYYLTEELILLNN